MPRNEVARSSGNYERARTSIQRDAQIIPATWTNEQTRAIEIGVGGGFILMTILAVVL